MTGSEREARARRLAIMTRQEGWADVEAHINEVCQDIVSASLSIMRYKPGEMTTDEGFVRAGRIHSLMDLKEWVRDEIKQFEGAIQ